MKRYLLFSEHCDINLWGENLADAVRRTGKLPIKSVVENGTLKHLPPLVVKSVLGMRDTTGSTRGHWKYESAVVELDGGRIIEVDARLDGEMIPCDAKA